MIARNANQRHCTKTRWMPSHAAHAASVDEYEVGAEPWNDEAVTPTEFLRELAGGIIILVGGIIVAALLLV